MKPADEIVPAKLAVTLPSLPTVLVAEIISDSGLDLLKKFAKVDCLRNLSPEELCSIVPLYDALIVRNATKVTRKVLEASGGRLKVVGRAGVGLENVDLEAAREVGCLVINLPNVSTSATAEHAIALLTSLARNVQITTPVFVQ